jgi:aerobic carbon-monoxide dehydrogenase small subunit
MAKKTPIQFRLNGQDRAAFVDAADNLLNTLRRSMGDFAPKYGCGQGTCGVCTVVIDGEPHLSCLTLSVACEGKAVETASGMANGPELHPLQSAFMDHFAAQCGFCTPGMLMAARALLDRNPNPTRQDVVEGIAGNICRCTGYEPIIAAVLDAAQRAGGRRHG